MAEERERVFLKVKVKTDHPHPLNSPDYLDPAGSIEDNSSSQYFIYELQKSFHGFPFRVLDLGCAGGQFVVDIYNKGFPWVAVGIEGGNIYGMTKEFEEKECETGALSIARGAQNWKQYEGKCLFHADISKPFEVLKQEELHEVLLKQEKSHDNSFKNASRLTFNVITAYEFLEHPLPEEIPQILENVKNHLHGNGYFVGTINLSPGDHHRCPRPVEWWNNIFEEHGFDMYQYPFMSSPRTGLWYLSQLVKWCSENPHVPAHLVLRRDQSVIGPRHIEKQLIEAQAYGHLEDLGECNEENYPFCARLKRN